MDYTDKYRRFASPTRVSGARSRKSLRRLRRSDSIRIIMKTYLGANDDYDYDDDFQIQPSKVSIEKPTKHIFSASAVEYMPKRKGLAFSDTKVKIPTRYGKKSSGYKYKSPKPKLPDLDHIYEINWSPCVSDTDNIYENNWSPCVSDTEEEEEWDLPPAKVEEFIEEPLDSIMERYAPGYTTHKQRSAVKTPIKKVEPLITNYGRKAFSSQPSTSEPSFKFGNEVYFPVQIHTTRPIRLRKHIPLTSFHVNRKKIYRRHVPSYDLILHKQDKSREIYSLIDRYLLAYRLQDTHDNRPTRRSHMPDYDHSPIRSYFYTGLGGSTDPGSPVAREPLIEMPKVVHRRRKRLTTAPFFSLPLRRKTIVEGQTAVLVCTVQGIPEATVSWTKNGREIRDGGAYKMGNKGGTCSLEIANAQQSDTGTYRCQARNAEGEEFTTCELVVEEDFPPDERLHYTRPSFLKPLRSICIEEGKTARFEIMVTGKPEPELTWCKDGDTIYPTSRILIEKYLGGAYALSVGNVAPSDAGRYTLLASSPAGAVSCAAELAIVKAEANIKDSEFDRDGQSHHRRSRSEKTQRERRSPRKSSRLSQSFTTDYESRRHHRTRYSSPDTTGSYAVSSGTSQYSSSSRNRYDRYLTTGYTRSESPDTSLDRRSRLKKSDDDEKTSDGRIQVDREIDDKEGTGPPVFIQKLKDVSVYEGDMLVLEVEIDGAQPMDVGWLRDGKDIPDGGNYKYISKGKVYQLEITEILPEDSGKYTCEALNDHGEADSSAVITAQEAPSVSVSQDISLSTDQPAAIEEDTVPPEFFEKPKSIVVGEGSSAIFSCDVDGDPLPTLSWYRKNDDTPLRENQRFKFTDEKFVHTFEIPSSIATDGGIYTCKASNSEGDVVAEFELSVTSDKADSEGVRESNLQQSDHTNNVTQDDNSKKIVEEVPTNNNEAVETSPKSFGDKSIKPDDNNIKNNTDVQIDSESDEKCGNVDKQNISIIPRGDNINEGFSQGTCDSNIADTNISDKQNRKEEIDDSNKDGRLGKVGKSRVRIPSWLSDSAVPDRKTKTAHDEPHKVLKSKPEILSFTITTDELSQNIHHDIQLDINSDRPRVNCNVQGSRPIERQGRDKSVNLTPTLERSLALSPNTPDTHGDFKKKEDSTDPTETTDIKQPMLYPSYKKRNKGKLEDAKYKALPPWLQHIGSSPVKQNEVSDSDDDYDSDESEENSNSATHENLEVESCEDRKMNGSVPEHPVGQPHVSNITNSSLTLAWYEPTFDGGSEITSYKIEACKNSTWTDIAEVNTTVYNVTDLHPDTEYKFRVTAVNVHGCSAVSKFSKSVVTKDPTEEEIAKRKKWVKPYFERQICNAEAVQGKETRFDCVVKGTPVPNVKWFKNREELKDSRRYQFAQGVEIVSLQITKAEEADSGNYICGAENSAGIAFCKATLVIKSNQ